MKIIEKILTGRSRSDIFRLHPIGDSHVGKLNCHESGIRRVVKEIDDNPNAIWFSGGDNCDCIKPQDVKRFSPDTLPDWLLQGDADKIRENLSDIVSKQEDRFYDFVEPIKGKCVGMISGNHEATMVKSYNYNIHGNLCKRLETQDLTDTMFMRLRFNRLTSTGNSAQASVTIFATHGHGGGRTAGSEPNHLAKLIQDKDADVFLRGHSHTFYIPPEVPVLYIPKRGKLPKGACQQRFKYAANWGAYVKSYSVGPPTYDSRAQYPARVLKTCCVEIKPFATGGPHIKIIPINLVR